jgi:hypothetical protein
MKRADGKSAEQEEPQEELLRHVEHGLETAAQSVGIFSPTGLAPEPKVKLSP